MKKRLLLAGLVISTLLAFSQTVVPVGGGSYASTVPTSESTYNAAFMAAKVNVADTNTRPIPTNDWWSDVLFSPLAGNLWAYPITVDPENYGFEFYNPTTFTNGGPNLDNPIEVRANTFNPIKNIAKNWSDWDVTVNLTDGTKYMDIQLVHGMPFSWVETDKINPELHFPNGGATFTADNGTAITFPFTGDHLAITYAGKKYSVHAAATTQFTRAGNVLTLNYGGGKGFFVLAVLNNSLTVSEANMYAFSKPINTAVSWNYQPEIGKLSTTWNIETINLKGAAERKVLQGFLQHHYRDAALSFPFSNTQYAVNHGLLKCAVGNQFTFTYDFNGVLPHLPLPTVQNVTNPYDPVKMETIFSKNLTDAGAYGNDTYWGGKDLIRMAKYTLMAKQMNHPRFNEIKGKTEKALADWFTYTPGEPNHYFAKLGNWDALIGYSTSFGSEEFIDNHFHYGYHTYAASMLNMADPSFGKKYGEMTKLVAKQYANWDRNDKRFPFLRTFDVWLGHSYAGGKSSGNGNNQESTSEAVQSWAGVFLLGETLEDNAMRAAGAFGYLMETRATLEYWFDWKNETFDATNYDKDIVGILFNGGRSYGTWFSGRPLHIYGIQWLPWSPVMNHMVKDPVHARSLYTSLMNAEGNPTDEAASFGDDWANVVFAYEQMFDPAHVAKRLDAYYASNSPVVRTYPTGGLTYYYTHSNRTLGTIQWDHHISIPTSTSYYNATTKVYSYVIHNTTDKDKLATVYKAGVKVMTVNVPANTLIVAHPNTTITSLKVSSEADVVAPSGELQLSAKGVDEFGVEFILSNVTWAVSGGGTINTNGVFKAGTAIAYPITVTASYNGMTATKTIRVGSLPKPVTMAVSPAVIKAYINEAVQFEVTGLDQYGNTFNFDAVTWTVKGKQATMPYITSATPEAVEVIATQNGVSRSALLLVRQRPTVNIALSKPATATSKNGNNDAAKANDGSGRNGSRWESASNDKESLTIDFQANYDLASVKIAWENAYAKEYTIDVSTNGVDYQTIYTQAASNGGDEVFNVTGTARYFRVNCTKRATGYGNSIWELEVYGTLVNNSATVSSVVLVPSKAEMYLNDEFQFKAYALDANLNCLNTAGTWTTTGNNQVTTTGLVKSGSATGNFKVSYKVNTITTIADYTVLNAENPRVDCNGVLDGSANKDVCGQCAGGNTGVTPNNCITGVESTIETELVIYPNPSDNGVFYLSENTLWTVYTMQGEVLETGKGNTISLVNHKAGTYLVKCNNQSQVIVVY